MTNNYAAALRSRLKSARNGARKTPEDTYFDAMAAEAVLSSYRLTGEEILDGIVDGSGDGGIDSVYIFVDDELMTTGDEPPTVLRQHKRVAPRPRVDVYVIQSKETTEQKSQPIGLLKSSLSSLLNFGIDETSWVAHGFRTEVIEKFSFLRMLCVEKLVNPQIHVHTYLCTLASDENRPERIALEAQGLIDVIENIGMLDVDFSYLGAKEVWMSLNRTSVDAIRFYNAQSIQQSDDSGSSSYICLCTIENYLKFISTPAEGDSFGEFRRDLYDRNVRDHEGERTDVNTAIRERLKSPAAPEFWWLNNGITVVCDQVISRRDHLELHNPQIVNGLQTSHTIYSSYIDGQISKQSLDSSILVRIIQTDDASAVNEVIRATNHQNAVKIDSIRSLDHIHSHIEVDLLNHGLYYDRRRNYYRNQGHPSRDIVSLRQVVQAFLSVYRGMPDYARARPGNFLKNDSEYQEIFSSSINVKAHSWAVRAMRRVDTFLREDTELDRSARNDLLFLVLAHVPRRGTGVKTIKPSSLFTKDLEEIYSKDSMAESLERVQSRINCELPTTEGRRDLLAKSSDFVEALFREERKGMAGE